MNEIRPEPRTNAVEICNVTKIFAAGDRPVVAVDDLSVAIRENELFTLLGPSGCGKTTLLRLIAGLEHATSGHILLQGSDVTRLPPYQRSVNTVFQSYALFPHLTVAGNIAFGLEMLGKPRSEVADSVAEMLRLVQLEAFKDRRIGQLSGGEQQRVALARALAPHPQVLLLDEPLAALDLKLRKAMQIELKRLQKQTRITFVFVTHDQGEALAISDRIGVMNAGRILQIGTPREVYEHPNGPFVAQFIGDSNLLIAELIAVNNGCAELRLSSGSTIETRLPETRLPAKASETSAGRLVSLVIRPEHATLTRTPNKAVLSGEIDNVVYLGTDTCYHLKLAGGELFVVRMRSRHKEEPQFREGESVGIKLQGNAVRILED